MGAVIRSEKTRRASLAVVQMLAVAAAYYVGGRLGLIRQVVADGAVVTPLWPPTGIALCCLLWMGLRIWPGIALGSLLITGETGGSFSLSGLCITAGNTVAPVLAYLMLRRAGFRTELDRLRDGVVLVFLGALSGMLISASVGAGVLLLGDELSLREFWPVWSAWWAGDAMGVLVVGPLLLVVRRFRLPRATDRWIEATTLMVASVLVTLIATRSSLSLLCLVFPLLIWAALRFQLPGSAPCAALVSVLAIVSATSGSGPFTGHTIFEIMVNLAALNGSVALTALLLSAVVTEHKNIRRKIERACEELADVVEQLAPGRAAVEWPVRGENRQVRGENQVGENRQDRL